MTYALAPQTSGDYDSVLDSAHWAERNGLEALALPDHYLMTTDESTAAVPAFDAFAQLAALARETTVIQLSVLVSPITFRHPAVLAKTAITIDHLSEGRFALGLGTGWLEREHAVFGFDFPPIGVRFAQLEEALAYVRAVFDDTQPGFAGNSYRLEPVVTAPRPQGPLPLVVGGTGPHATPRLAGTYANEYNCYPAPIEEFAARVDRARRAAVEAGRDPDQLLISSAGAVLAAETQGDFEQLLTSSAAEADMTVDELEAHLERRNTPRGTFDRVAEQLAAMAAAGMRRFYIQRSADFDRAATERLITALEN
jgi:alkanesulfonate monooxygenase SsuD/methylene tetrahydromethanopterin reductase-like flavin-dependent oxidoreductase (luciferase family)